VKHDWLKETFDDGVYFMHSDDCPNFCEYACGGKFYDPDGSERQEGVLSVKIACETPTDDSREKP